MKLPPWEESPIPMGFPERSFLTAVLSQGASAFVHSRSVSGRSVPSARRMRGEAQRASLPKFNRRFEDEEHPAGSRDIGIDGGGGGGLGGDDFTDLTRVGSLEPDWGAEIEEGKVFVGRIRDVGSRRHEFIAIEQREVVSAVLVISTVYWDRVIKVTVSVSQ